MATSAGDAALAAAATALLQARRAGRVNANDEQAVLNLARYRVSPAAAAAAARDCALAGLTGAEPFASLAAAVSRRGDDEATFETSDGRNYVLSVTDTAPARAQCGLAALRLPHQTWRRLGGKVKFSDDAALSELWDYSKKRKKVLQAPNDRGGFAWPPVFEDPSRPLVIDAGCGFGALAVNLAKTRPHVNVLAVDRAAHCLLYGSGLAHRLVMTGCLHFACASADEALHWARHCYSAPLRAILFMFPTPPALDDRSKNAQLPQKQSACLMNAATLKLAARAGSKGTCVLVASNVEDVAVRTRDLFEQLPEYRVARAAECGIACPRLSMDDPSLRTQRWVAAGGARAVGADFLAASPLPSRTETEGRYESEGRAVYRVAGVVL